MTTYVLHVAPQEVVRLVRAARGAAGGEPELHIHAARDYIIEEEYDRPAHGLAEDDPGSDLRETPGGNQYDLVTEQAVLNVEPRIERDHWVLSVVARKRLGPRAAEAGRALTPTELTLDQFEHDFIGRNGRDLSVRLKTASPQARQNFGDWWTELTARHTRHAETPPLERAGQNGQGSRNGSASPHEAVGEAADADTRLVDPEDNPWSAYVREAVALFGDIGALRRAMDALRHAGFDRGKITIFGLDSALGADLAALYHSKPAVTTDSAELSDLHVEGQAQTIAVPVHLRGIADATAVLGGGGALAAAVSDALAGGEAAADIDRLMSASAGPSHAARYRDEVAKGGVALWLALYNLAAENRALSVLQDAGARELHVHQTPRYRGPGNRPTPGPQLDPFLPTNPKTPRGPG